MKLPIPPPEVAAVIDAYPPWAQNKVMALRALIFDVAAQTDGAGVIEETLKWGEPAYVTAASMSGSTIRVAWKQAKASRPTHYALYFNCQTTLVIFAADDKPPVEALRICVAMALTYNLKKTKTTVGSQAKTSIYGNEQARSELSAANVRVFKKSLVAWQFLKRSHRAIGA
jgi:hypothetical protein